MSGGAGGDTFFGDGIDEVTVAVGGRSRNGVNPEYEVYAECVLIFTGEVTWAQDGSGSFDPNAPGAFQDVTCPCQIAPHLHRTGGHRRAGGADRFAPARDIAQDL